MRTILTYMLIVIVAVCPYFCLGSIADDVDVRAVSCSCCQTCGSSGDESPDNSDTGEPDCLCHGAILHSKIECPDATASDLNTYIALSWFTDTTFDCCSLSVPDASRSCHYPLLSTGREICSLISVQLL